MSQVEREKKRTAIRAGILIGIAGLIAINLGVLALLNQRLHYRNYWGGWVFAPFAICAGIAAIVAALYAANRK